MKAEQISALIRGAEVLGVPLDQAALDRFATYQALLQEWGAKMNLTAIRDPREVVTHHFLDSLAIIPHLPRGQQTTTLIDVGSGAGFPGAVCALVCPDWQVTLVERTQKKAAFLMTLRRELGLPTMRVLAAEIGQVRDHFQVVVSRAAFPPPVWLAVGAPLVAKGGRLLAMISVKEPELSPPPGFVEVVDASYDVGAGPHRIRGWQKCST